MNWEALIWGAEHATLDSWHTYAINFTYNCISSSTATSLFCLPPFNYSIWGIQIQTIFAVLIPKAKKKKTQLMVLGKIIKNTLLPRRPTNPPWLPFGLSLLAARFKITLMLSSSIGLLFVIGSITISPLLDWVFLPKQRNGSGTLGLFFCPIYYLNYPKKRGTIWLLSYLVKINWHQILIWFS